MAALCLRFAPSQWHGRHAEALWNDDLDLQRAMARGVDGWRHRGLNADDLLTGSQRFDGEWLFGTYMMAALGYAQLAKADPEHHHAYMRAMEDCIDQLLSAPVRAFDRAAWGSDPLADLGTDRGHAAYLGYLALVLSAHRSLDPQSRFAEIHDRICEHLARNLERSPVGLVPTYPSETYPVDNTAIFGALALHQRATGADHSTVLARARKTLRRFTDQHTGLLIQKVGTREGQTVDGPRGSGTALATYFLSFWDEELSAALYQPLRRELRRDLLGFAAIREYPEGVHGRGDIDSGPVVLGVSVSSTGFALAGARIHGDKSTFTGLVRTAYLFGAPTDRDDRRNFAFGGPLGDALMFALLTARPSASWGPQ